MLQKILEVENLLNKTQHISEGYNSFTIRKAWKLKNSYTVMSNWALWLDCNFFSSFFPFAAPLKRQKKKRKKLSQLILRMLVRFSPVLYPLCLTKWWFRLLNQFGLVMWDWERSQGSGFFTIHKNGTYRQWFTLYLNICVDGENSWILTIRKFSVVGPSRWLFAVLVVCPQAPSFLALIITIL